MRKKTNIVPVGNLHIGGNNPIVIQSMTNTDTSDRAGTLKQLLELYEAGAKILRMTVNDIAAAREVARIIEGFKKKIKAEDYAFVGDFHFNGNILLRKAPECALALDKYRINPGNADDENFQEMVEIAIKNKKAIRIGVNGGSLDQKKLQDLMDQNAKSKKPKSSEEIFVRAMIESAIDSQNLARGYGIENIILSAKTSDVGSMVKIYRELSKKSSAPLHLGLTEAGAGLQGTVSSSIALGILLQEGIGDTIRVSVTPEKNIPRTQEIKIAQNILQSLAIRNFRPKVISCPGCGRTTSRFFQDLASRVNQMIDAKMPIWKQKYAGVESLQIGVMGCVVNGPGESKNADIAISLPGKMEKAQAPVYIDGELSVWLKGDNIETEFIDILETYIHKKFK